VTESAHFVPITRTAARKKGPGREEGKKKETPDRAEGPDSWVNSLRGKGSNQALVCGGIGKKIWVWVARPASGETSFERGVTVREARVR